MFAAEMKHVFVALLEVRPLDGCQLDPSEYDGAAVRCYIPAEDEKAARSSLSLTLDRHRFELVKEEFFVRHDLAKWDNAGNEDAAKAIAEAKNTGLVVYSEFWAWDHSDPDARRNQTGEPRVAPHRSLASKLKSTSPVRGLEDT